MSQHSKVTVSLLFSTLSGAEFKILTHKRYETIPDLFMWELIMGVIAERCGCWMFVTVRSRHFMLCADMANRLQVIWLISRQNQWPRAKSGCSVCFDPLCRCLSKTENTSQAVCKWDYDGTGEQYQILAGPVFILVYTLSGIPLGFLSGVYNRKNILAFCLILWSSMTLLTGFSTQYWHLVVTRFILGIGSVFYSFKYISCDYCLWTTLFCDNYDD